MFEDMLCVYIMRISSVIVYEIPFVKHHNSETFNHNFQTKFYFNLWANMSHSILRKEDKGF